MEALFVDFLARSLHWKGVQPTLREVHRSTETEKAAEAGEQTMAYNSISYEAHTIGNIWKKKHHKSYKHF